MEQKYYWLYKMGHYTMILWNFYNAMPKWKPGWELYGISTIHRPHGNLDGSYMHKSSAHFWPRKQLTECGSTDIFQCYLPCAALANSSVRICVTFCHTLVNRSLLLWRWTSSKKQIWVTGSLFFARTLKSESRKVVALIKESSFFGKTDWQNKKNHISLQAEACLNS